MTLDQPLASPTPEIENLLKEARTFPPDPAFSEQANATADVYLEAARRLDVPASRCAAVEDSASGIRAAREAGMRVIAYPNRHYPPAADVLASADVVIDSLDALGSTTVAG